MLAGTFSLGVGATLGLGRIGGGISQSLDTTSGSGFLAVANTTGLFAGVGFGATLAIVRDGANELYYEQPVELSEIREGGVRHWYSERLRRAIADVAATAQEQQP